MRTILVTISSFLMFWSCSQYKPISKEIKQKFTNRFDSNGTNIQNLIDIDGYYQIYYLKKGSYGYGKDMVEFDSSASNMIFFKDGTYASSFFFKEGSSENEICNNFNQHVKYIKETFKVGYWGIYRIEGDTIIVQNINHAGSMIPWDFREKWYLVMDRKTLKLIKVIPLLKQDIDTYGINMWADGIKDYSPVRFMKADSIPPPNCWLKEEKWLWKNESDWVKYMESHKKKKKRE